MGLAERGMFCGDGVNVMAGGSRERRHDRLLRIPGPCIGEPKLGNDVQSGRIWSTVIACDTDEQVFGIVFILGILLVDTV